MWYSEAVVQEIHKICRKTTVPKSLFKQSCRSIEKETPTVFLKNTSRKLLWILNFCFELVLYRYSRNNWIFFQVIRLFLLLRSGFKLWRQGMLISPANRTKQRLYWQSIHASVNIMKIRNFLCSFYLKFSLLNRGSLTFLV